MKGNFLLACALLLFLAVGFFAEARAQGLLEEATFCNAGTTRPCPDIGVCKNRFKVCENGKWSDDCRGGVGPAPQEVCDNGLDDNCNGAVDECVSLSGSFGIFLIIGGVLLLFVALVLSRFYK